MGVWVAFLRGMNLGGRRLTNDELCAAVAACGCLDPTAYQASGNVVFSDSRDVDELADTLPVCLERELGYPVPTFLRTAQEVRAIADAQPFTEDQLAASTGKPQVVLLHEPPSGIAEEVLELAPAGEVLLVDGPQLYWLPSAGVSDSKLDLRRLDGLTGGATVRTHGTIQRLAKKFL